MGTIGIHTETVGTVHEYTRCDIPWEICEKRLMRAYGRTVEQERQVRRERRVLIACACFWALWLASAAMAAEGKGAFLAQQAYDETRRLSGQVDVIQNNVDDLSARISRLERGNGSSEVEALKARVAALEASNAELKRQLGAQRNEIVNDLSSKIKKLQPAVAPQPVATGPHREYEVKSGDTLSLIAEAFNTNVAKIKQMNGLKNDNLRIGQKLKVPME